MRSRSMFQVLTSSSRKNRSSDPGARGPTKVSVTTSLNRYVSAVTSLAFARPWMNATMASALAP